MLIEQRKKQQLDAKKAARLEKKKRKKQKRKKVAKALLKLSFIGIFAFIIIQIILFSQTKTNEPSGVLESLVLSTEPEQNEFNIGDTVVIWAKPTPSNPSKVPSGEGATSYYSSTNIEFYLRNGEDNISLGNGGSISYTFDESGEYVFWAKYCPHGWNCDPAYDIVSEDFTVNVNGNPISTIEELQALNET